MTRSRNFLDLRVPFKNRFFALLAFGLCVQIFSLVALGEPHCAKPGEKFSREALPCGLVIPRYVSLAPNLTEILFAIGASPLVATTEQCDFPSEALKTKKVGNYSNPQFELIVQARPSHVFATEGNPKILVEKLRSQGIAVIESNPKTLREVPASIIRLAKVAQLDDSVQNKARLLAEQLEKALKTLPGAKENGPKALLVLQWEPIYSASNSTWLGDFLVQAGFQNIVGQSALPYPVVSQEFLRQNKPQVVFAAGAWKRDEKSEVESARVAKEAQQQLVKLYGTRAPFPKVIVLPPDIFVRPGPRLLEAIDFLKSHSADSLK